MQLKCILRCCNFATVLHKLCGDFKDTPDEERNAKKKKKSKLPLISTDIRFTKKARENKAI